MKKWFLSAVVMLSLLSAIFNPSPGFSSDPDKKNTLDLLGLASEQEEFLKREEAFQFSADLDEQQIFVRWKIADGYYLYKERFNFSATGATLGTAEFPEGDFKYDEFFEKEMEVFHQFIEIHLPLTNITGPITLSAGYQGCAEKGLCYTPAVETISFNPDGSEIEASEIETPKEQSISSSAGTNSQTPDKPVSASLKELSNDQQAVADYLKDSTLLITMGLFLLLGLGLTFTPCVFPMMPILASIIAGQGKTTTSRAFWLSFTYVQGMALTYVLLGMLTASVGHSLAGMFQSTWVVVSAALIFVLLSLSMFGFYELTLPSKWQSKLTGISNSQTGGTFIGVAIMGILSALIVSPCITAPLSGALIHIANTGDYVFGGLTMYALAMGMGIPLILIGVSEGKLLPKAGGWMDGVKAAFGVSMLAVALIITDHLIPGPILLILWGLLFMGSGVYLGAFDATPEAGWSKFWKAIGIALVIWSVILIIGAAQGNGNLLKPLEQRSVTITGADPGTHSDLPFIEVEPNAARLREAVAKANAQGKTVMLDLYADWCTACEEFASITFPDPKVREALRNTAWLQMDLTETNDANNRFMEEFDVLGLPSIMFFGSSGEELTRSRVTGFMDAEDFSARINKTFKN